MNPATNASARTLRRPNQFLKEHPEFAPGGLRDQIFKADSNGLTDAGAIIRVVAPGAKRGIVYIDVDRYFEWLTSGQRIVTKPRSAKAAA